MEQIHIPESQPATGEKKTSGLHMKYKKPTPMVIAAGGAVLLIIVALFFAKGMFVVATVNGSPISRLSVIRELEKQGGKQTLQVMIDKKLIADELARKNISITPESVDEEIRKIEAQVAGQGGTLVDALAMQGMTIDALREQITMQKQLEIALGDKLAVSAEEIDAFIIDTKAAPHDSETQEDFRKEIEEQIRQQKFQTEAQQWVSSLTESAKIKYYVEYK